MVDVMDSKHKSSRIKDLVQFLASTQGDLSNITAPPMFLAPTSVVEVGRCWAEHPAIFAAPALEPDPARRALLVLTHMLSSLRSQLYIDGSPTVSIKKPLNAFLGELFLASFVDAPAKATTTLVAEQVSHHPPITAMHVSDTANGIRADGYARVEMSFSGTVDIRQVGHAVLHIDRYAEDYLIPLPAVQVRGFLGGRLYPEMTGVYTIPSSGAYVSQMRFSGAGLCWGGRKNGFTAVVFRRDDPRRAPVYSLEGVWSDAWTVRDARGDVVDTFRLDEATVAPLDMAPLDAQDPWESKRAWRDVAAGLRAGDVRAAVAAKTELERAQREMRAAEADEGRTWTPLLFRSAPGAKHDVFHRLAEGMEGWEHLYDDRTKGVWRVDEAALATQRPFRGELTPLG
ncbi:hypothetical protein VD0002_g4240 [Verticillium dahliae]|uniref:Kes1 n=3 Tax=Verticillium dahliae TaxID=27337 RepID=G2WYE3_VERDV|nr:kes1 [Verticillium dahliae VdLs.17]EGY21101.1 kes1 [Verticillium dahliae VdLs.17]PNH31481.1 hypothetical protein BJF96_g5252 [Verticillium dahliae]PNH64439.1 hypothetical protein VD0002_g4240 [Verticillium dahliae]